MKKSEYFSLKKAQLAGKPKFLGQDEEVKDVTDSQFITGKKKPKQSIKPTIHSKRPSSIKKSDIPQHADKIAQNAIGEVQKAKNRWEKGHNSFFLKEWHHNKAEKHDGNARALWNKLHTIDPKGNHWKDTAHFYIKKLSQPTLSSPIKKEELVKKEISADEETAKIKENKLKPENQKRHKFKAAHWTHPNGHPRCIRCGDEETTDGYCGPDLGKSEEIPAKEKGLKKSEIYFQNLKKRAHSPSRHLSRKFLREALANNNISPKGKEFQEDEMKDLLTAKDSVAAESWADKQMKEYAKKDKQRK